jgi:hypothetical protein
MNKARLNYWIDIALAISFFACFLTGIVKWPGIFSIGISSRISKLHDVSGLIMGLLVLVHLILHWSWIVFMTKGIFIKK